MPFTRTEFLDVFGAFNAAFEPVLIVLWLASAGLAIQLVRGRAPSRLVSALMAFHWAWAGIAYHAMFFTSINPAAWLFAALFLAQASGVLWRGLVRPRLMFEWGHSIRHVWAAVFLGFALLYPALIALTGHVLPLAPAFGVPCPTTLFTTGLLLAATPPVSRSLLVVPILWSAVGGSAALLFGMTPDLMLLVAGSTLLFYGLVDARWSVRASEQERKRVLPGDDLIQDPIATLTHAITIVGQPRDVWPWLIQMGAGRAGWYSYDWLDNGRQRSAEHIVPALQQIHVGKLMPALPGATDGFTVLRFDAERSLIIGWLFPDGARVVTWAFVLEPTNESTRLIVRVRGGPGYRFHGLPTWAARLVVRPIHFVMQRRQLLGLVRRVEHRGSRSC